MSGNIFRFNLSVRSIDEGELIAYRDGELTYDVKAKGIPIKVVVDPRAIGSVMGLVAQAIDGEGILVRIEVD